MAKEPDPASSTQPAADSHADLQETLESLKQNRSLIVAAVGVAFVVFISVWGVRFYTQSQAGEALERYTAAQSVEDLQALVDEFPDSAMAPLARLGLAQDLYHQGQPSQALTLYEAFLTANPDHILTPAAELGRATCLESINQLDQALDAYAQFLQSHPDHYLLPMAIFGRARTLELLGRTDDARIAYEDFIAQNPDSDWIPQAETSLEYLKRGQPDI